MSSSVASATPSAAVLSPKTLRSLRARAHALKPAVRIAGSGLSEGVLQELDRTLTAHELVKIHAAVDDRNERAGLLDALCRLLNAEPVQVIGKMLVAYRERAEAPGTGDGAAREPGRKRPAKRAAGAATKDTRRRASRDRGAVAARRQPRKPPPRRKG